MNYYNDFESYVCEWLTNLAQADRIPAGFVDNRSIKEVIPDDVRNYTQAHFFAGIGTWAYALRLAGWPDTRPVWTGSCPCQPFSTAGKRGGTDDVRHLWPEWFRLIRECRPPVIFGEQVASSDGLDWLDIVCADLESEGYTVAAVDLCAAGAGAPHLRQRLYFVANSNERRCGTQGEWGRLPGEVFGERTDEPLPLEERGSTDLLAESRGIGWGGRGDGDTTRGGGALQVERRGELGGMAHADGEQEYATTARGLHADSGECGILGDTNRKGRSVGIRQSRNDGSAREQATGQALIQTGYWSDLEWLPCRDGKARPTKPGLFPLAHGTPRRVAKLRAIGNAIVAPLAAEFIRAYMDLEGGNHA